MGLACAGASAFASQVLLLREFLNVFGGNELVVGSLLANWLLLTGAGALLGQHALADKASRTWVAVLLMVAAVALPLQFTAIRMLRSQIPAGLVPGISEAVFWSAAVLFLPCMINGFLVPTCARLLAIGDAETAPGRSYLLDTAGAALGGALGVFMVTRLGAFQSAALVIAASGAGAALMMLDTPSRPLSASLFAFIALGSAITPILMDADERTAGWLFPGQRVLWQRHTPYGHLAATQYGPQITIHLNALPAGSTDDIAGAEEIVHCTFGHRPGSGDVLLLSGGLLGVLREAAKYPARTITLIESDPETLRIVASMDPASTDPRVRLVAGDPRSYLRMHPGAFDAIASALPDPLTLGANRFFTAEFFRDARRALRDGGVLGMGIGASQNVVTRLDLGALTSVTSALRSVFKHTAAIPGARVLIAASDSPLEGRVDQALMAAGIKATYVNPAWFSERLSHGRMTALEQTLRSPAAPNRDFLPSAFAAAASKWTLMAGGHWLLGIGAVIIMAFGLALVWSSHERPVLAAIGASGFAGMGLEVVILLAFQVSRGSLYLHVTAILWAFLVGAALGGLHGCRITARPMSTLMATDLGIAIAALLAPSMLGFLHSQLPASTPGWLAATPFAIYNGLVGYLAGAQFQPAAARLLASSSRGPGLTTGRLYGVDLVGGSLGAIAVALLMIPSIGVATTCYLIGGLKLCTALTLAAQPRSTKPVACAASPRWTFATMLFALGIAGILIVTEETSSAMGAFAGSRWYHGFALALLALAYLGAMGVAPLPPATRSRMPHWLERPKTFRWIQFIGLGLVVFYPLFRCFFKIPYVFCHVCPRQCVFGYFRPYLIPAALLMNLRARHWCHHACPVGSLQHQQGGGRPLPRWLMALPLCIAAACALAWFRVRADAAAAPEGGGPWFQFFFKNGFTSSGVVLGSVAVILVLGWVWHRVFCGGICPVGGVSELLTRVERWLNGHERSRGEP